jgi:outer membrane protein
MKKQNTVRMKTILSLFVGLIIVSALSAQKYAYVDTEYILENIPEYKDAQNQIDELAIEFQEEIIEARAVIDKMYKNYEAESVLMPDDIKEKKLDEIRKKEDEVKQLQNQRFGVDGDLFLKREELVKPIQEKIYNSIEEIATEKNYAFVFDKAGSLTILFVNSKFDISDDILDMVGAELGTVRREDRVKNEYKGGTTPENKPTQNNTNQSNSRPQPPGGNAPPTGGRK